MTNDAKNLLSRTIWEDNPFEVEISSFYISSDELITSRVLISTLAFTLIMVKHINGETTYETATG